MKPIRRRFGGLDRRGLGATAVALAALATACWAGCSGSPSTQDAASEPGSTPAPAGGQTPGLEAGQADQGKQPSARAVLDRMVEAYRNASSYADKGQMRITGRINGQQINQPAPYTAAFQRPNKIRLEVLAGIVVGDGEHLWAFAMNLPNQVLRRPAPAVLSPAAIFSDSILAGAMAQGPTQLFSWVPLQAILLLADDPLKSLLHLAEAPQMLPPEMIGPNRCYRVAAARPDGTAVFWIDQASYVLRRFEFPTSELKKMFSGGQVENFSLTAELTDAQLNTAVDPNAFKFETPPEAEVVEKLRAPGMQLLGKPVPAFTFVDLKGNQVTPQSLAGKVVVLDFWATWCDPCRQTLPVLETVYQEYKDNPKVTFLALSLDQPEVDDATVQATFDELKVTVPIARDPQQFARKAFGVASIPAMVLLGADGVVQVFETGETPGLEVGLPMVLENLLAGGEVYRQKLDQFERGKARFAEWLAGRQQDDMYAGPLTWDQEPPRVEIAPHSEPKSLKLTQLWRCDKLDQPGNLLVVPRQGGPPEILVVDSGRAIAEIGPNGSLGAVHELPVHEGQAVSFLRTAVGADGRRYFAASANGALQLFLLDAEFRVLAAYPADAAQNPHTGIGDVQFTDLDGDGVLELGVGYWGVVGVQGVSLKGERIWANRSLASAFRLAPLDPDAQGHGRLLATDRLGTLVMLGAGGKRLGEIQVPGLSLQWIVAADLDGDGQSELCGLAPTDQSQFAAVGVSLDGHELWRYPLPPGVHRYAIEPVTAGRLSTDGPGRWLLAAADGSIHVLGIDGQPVDQFHYGEALTGLATAELDGKPVLLVSTPKSLDAWQVEPAGP